MLRHKEAGPDRFRLRHGQWRAIYRIDREAQEMQGQLIDTRGSVYRWPSRRLTDEIVVLRRATYDACWRRSRTRDARALAELRAREASGQAEYVPIELADRIFAGARPVRAWREHRGLTLGALAKSAGIAPSYLSEIEAAKKPGSTRALAALAKSLRVAIEDLLPIER